jgi:hypothetical protein
MVRKNRSFQAKMFEKPTNTAKVISIALHRSQHEADLGVDVPLQWWFCYFLIFTEENESQTSLAAFAGILAWASRILVDR